MSDNDTFDFEICAVPLWAFFVVGERISLSEVAEFFEIEPNKLLASVGGDGLVDFDGYTLRQNVRVEATEQPTLAS